ncbi:hypothetical protein P154DRAFT_264771 [Amniculicola lignicola CBS 123094]|uniref:Rhodopsin domain-containing protein n=1 Tax=Amniculicola lignicola CBS 123094 TaxID=1392246 RepID=A0A6A5W8A0_9PLEO|nr:hypothetical protein P154DRAFT_264771 [Amniculicola lignicola CBS 123094]
MVICVCWSIASFIPFLFQCSPIYKAYRPWVKGKCFSLNKWLWGTTISNAIIDWMILLVPIVPLWTLNLSRMETPLVFAAFMFGSLACIASTARAALSVSLDYADFGVGSFFAVLTIFAEPMLAIISACLPFLPISRPLINAFLAFKRKVSQGSRHKATPKPDSGPSPQDSRAYIEDLSGSISLTHSRPSTITTVRPDTGERTREFVG